MSPKVSWKRQGYHIGYTHAWTHVRSHTVRMTQTYINHSQRTHTQYEWHQGTDRRGRETRGESSKPIREQHFIHVACCDDVTATWQGVSAYGTEEYSTSITKCIYIYFCFLCIVIMLNTNTAYRSLNLFLNVMLKLWLMQSRSCTSCFQTQALLLLL